MRSRLGWVGERVLVRGMNRRSCFLVGDWAIVFWVGDWAIAFFVGGWAIMFCEWLGDRVTHFLFLQ